MLLQSTFVLIWKNLLPNLFRRKPISTDLSKANKRSFEMSEEMESNLDQNLLYNQITTLFNGPYKLYLKILWKFNLLAIHVNHQKPNDQQLPPNEILHNLLNFSLRKSVSTLPSLNQIGKSSTLLFEILCKLKN